ncbi:TetR/AcrR family transcriptional regulator [Hyphomonas pacifica]|uniref:Uncharacterized protein n=1 Tax=Hyphomonas pacifica TaxID=1280941 RepID=A0A062TUL6_9PROT|nr:TetR family transcriptional regulator [Hyphomonas pacifica]KCZ48101.1 hypothetical protein HY2_16170 [Hyphomonas pacifica]RAN31597.1 hypothetical protein HY3_16480 [Hyphomonas pacifica]RAN34737.1 hypothetical protein HY11_14680 [Hyphomonas pacifica]
MPKPRARKALETRTTILRAARKRFSEDGYEASISSIVVEAGITKGALFHHFENKQNLYYEVWRDLQITMDNETRIAAMKAMSDEDPYAAFLAGARVYFDWVMREDYQRIVLLEGPRALGLAEWYEADHDLGQKNVRGGIQYLVDKGKIAPERADASAMIVQGALNGSGFALARRENTVMLERVLEVFEIMLRSLK